MRRKPSRDSLPPQAKRVGFLEEKPGVHSATRLVMVGLLALSTCVTLTLCAYVLFIPEPVTGVVASLTGALATLVVNGAVAIIRRS